jgi:flagellar hook-associated protein 3 FlgL
MSATTLVSDFNFGRGVEIADGAIDPITGLPDATRNLDFRISLRDGATNFDVDLVPSDMGSVQDVIDAINTAAGASFPVDFRATLASDGNGIVFEDDSLPVVGQTTVTRLNGYAAEDLGLLNATYTAGATATFAAEDRAKVRVDSVFTTLIELRTAMETNNERGITLAGESLAPDIDRLHQARATVGARASRLEAGRTREEDVELLNERLRSQLRDLDYNEASTRYALLQLAQQAGLATTARSFSLSLLDFLS